MSSRTLEQDILSFLSAEGATAGQMNAPVENEGSKAGGAAYDLIVQAGASYFSYDPRTAVVVSTGGDVEEVGGGVSSITIHGNTFEDADQRISVLEARVQTLEQEIEELRASSAEHVIVLRSVPREQAKSEIRALFEPGEVLYYSDISRRLRIELPLVVEICQELTDEGEIGIHDDAV
jgi:uncharacterized coiled-coil protein SlyX